MRIKFVGGDNLVSVTLCFRGLWNIQVEMGILIVKMPAHWGLGRRGDQVVM